MCFPVKTFSSGSAQARSQSRCDAAGLCILEVTLPSRFCLTERILDRSPQAERRYVLPICDSLLCYPKNCSEISFLKQQLRLSSQELTEKLKPTCVTNVSAPKLPCFPIKKIMRTPIVYSFFFPAPQKVLSTILN